MSEDLTLKRFVKRGTNPSDNPYAVKDAIIEQKSYVVVDGKIQPPNDRIWCEIKNKYGFKKSPKALYTFVVCNKWDIQVDLGVKLTKNKQPSITISSFVAEETELDDDEAEDTDPSDMTLNPESGNLVEKSTSTFTMFIPKEKWRIIEPEERTLVVNERGRQGRTRMYKVLKPGVWADVINNILWDQLRWRCCWRFKGNYISTSDRAQHWIVIRASCECGNKFTATCPNPPPKDPRDSGLTLKVTMFGEIETHIKNGTNRQVTGTKRKELGEELVNKKLKASYVRKLMASETMNAADPYPAHIPSNEVVRKIKSETIKSRRLDHDVYKALQILKYSTNPIYQNSIYDIGLDPFFIHVWTPNQIRIYNLYCQRSYSRLIIDATGKVVQKISKPKGNLSSHIFLYLGVVRLPGEGEGLIPVVQMLSERHNADAIEFWLKSWLREGGVPAPSEVILDDSAALISACCRVFGGEMRTSNYLTKCLSFLQDNSRTKPPVLIRIDVAHFTNMIRKWPEVSRMRSRTKEFYIRSIISVAKAESLDDAEELIKAIFVVALSETEGNSVSSGQLTPCEVEKKKLLSLIAGIEISEEANEISDEEDTSNYEQPGHERRPESICDSTETENICTMKVWIERVEEIAKKSVKDDGDRDNIMYEPVMVSKIKRLCYTLPLWCSALAVNMESPFPRAIGAYVEGEIGHIKANLVNEKMRADDFLVKYLTFCDGSLKLAGTMDVIRSGIENPPDKITLTPNDSETTATSCPACLSGNFPGGAHQCVACKKNVHVIEGCSFPVPGEEEGFGERRLCINCNSIPNNPSTSVSSDNVNPDKNQSTVQRDSGMGNNGNPLSNTTSIFDRPDLSVSNHDTNLNLEPTSIEGWKGLSIPKKKRQPPYYWTPSSDFPQLIHSGSLTKIGVLKNGTSPTLKVSKIGLQYVSLSNTCSFDAPAQIFATSYCDSKNYRDEINTLNINTTILEVSKNLATKGISQGLYNLRSKVLCKYIDSEPLKSGMILVNCAIDSSVLLRKMDMPPSLIETRTCNSFYCSAKITRRNGNVLSAKITGSEISQEVLEAALYDDVENISNCLMPIPDVNNVPEENFIIDKNLSEQGPVCSGKRTRTVQIGSHLIVEIVGTAERVHTDDKQYGVYNTVRCGLSDITRTVQFCGKTFNLRGVVAFKPPLRDRDAGHYVALSLRIGNKWEQYDDLKNKVTIMNGAEEVSVHLLLFTT